jgi:hypothetical protein
MSTQRSIEASNVQRSNERIHVTPRSGRRPKPTVDDLALDVQEVCTDIVREYLDGRTSQRDPHLLRDIDLLDVM